MNEPPLMTSRAEFVAAVHWGVQAAAERGARRLCFVDPNFADWPLESPALLELLTTWLRLPQRQVVLLAETFEEVVRFKPRFVVWRRSWAHAIQAWSPHDLPANLPTVLVDDGPVCVVLADRLHWRGRAAADARDAQRQREQIDAVLQRSEPAFPVNNLGL